MSSILVISKRSPLKGEDGHKIFSIRIKEETVKQLEEIATKTNRNRNQIVNMFLEYSLKNYEIDDWNKSLQFKLKSKIGY